MDILERESDLVALRRAVRGAARGRGSVVYIEGVAGVGKTTLLRALGDLAAESGMRVLEATGSPLELTVAFGIARQLLERPVAELSPQARLRVLDGPAADASAVLGARAADDVEADHALHWLIAGLAALQPLVLAVDDAHVADEASVRLLHHVGRRCAELSVAVVVAARPSPHPTAAPVLAALAAEAETVIRPEPLTAASVQRLVRQALGEPDAAFVAACERATGGNPFLLAELLRLLADARVEPVADAVDRVLAAAPDGVRRRVATTLDALGGDARAVAQAVAVLASADPARVAALAGVAPEAAARAAGALERAGLLERSRALRFAHPLLATAVEDTLTAAELSDAHVRAARLLDAAGAAADEAAAHLVASRPAADPWSAALLARAGEAAMRRGDPYAAVALYRRALDEPAPEAELAELLEALGVSLARTGRSDEAVATLRRAIDLGATDEDASRRLEALGRIAFVADDFAVAVKAFSEARAIAPTADQRVLAERNLLAIGLLERPMLATVAELRDAVLADPAADAELRAIAGAAELMRCAPAIEGLSLIGDTLERLGRTPTETQLQTVGWALVAMDVVDRTFEALRLVEQWEQSARASGDRGQLVYYLTLTAWLLYRLGRLGEAQAVADEADAVVRDLSGTTLHAHVLLDLLIDRGRPEEALRRHAEEPPETSQQRGAMQDLMKGRTLAAVGRDAEALVALRRAGRTLDALEMTHPGYAPWRPYAAPLMARAGEHDEARAVADEAVALARRSGAAGGIAMTLRARAETVGGDEAVEDARQAVALYEDLPYRRDRALALIVLGERLAEASGLGDARDALRRGLDLAGETGAGGLAERARAGLVRAGARPRREALTGVGALTPSELRASRLAAAGLTNRQIAEELFVTQKTVERHLKHAFGKLGVTRRYALAAALGDAAVSDEIAR